MKTKRVSEFLTENEIGAILRIPDRRTLKGKRDYAILLLMFSTGLRKAEVCSLRVADVTTYRNQPVVDVIGKGKRHRRIALNRDVMESILDYQKAFLPLSPSERLLLDNFWLDKITIIGSIILQNSSFCWIFADFFCQSWLLAPKTWTKRSALTRSVLRSVCQNP